MNNLLVVDEIINNHIEIHKMIDKLDIESLICNDEFVTKNGKKFKVKIEYELIK